MACLLAVFVPQNCPPSETFDKEVPRPLSRALLRLMLPLQYWHPCEVQENLTELDPYNTCVRFCCRCSPPALTLPLSSRCSFVIIVNFITCFACCMLYYAEYQRETFLIEFLDANPAERHALAPGGLCDD